MRNVQVWFDDRWNTYGAQIDTEEGGIEAATIGNGTKHSIDIWLNDHKVTPEEYKNAKFNY